MDKVIYVITLILLGMMISFSSCKCQGYIEKEVYIERIDTVIKVNSDTITNTIIVECDSTNTPIIIEKSNGESRRGNLISNTSLQNKTLTINNTATIDSLNIIIEKLRESKSIKQREIVEVPTIPSFYKNCTIGFWVLLIGIILLIVIKIIIKFYLK